MAVQNRSVVIDLSDSTCEVDADADGDGDARTPDTAISELQSTPKRPVPAPSFHSTLSPEGKKFFSDLNNFIAVGCIVLDYSTNDPVTTWEEIHVPDAAATFSALPEHLAQDVQKLLAHGLIRVCVAKPACELLRVHVLPGDVGHRFLQHQQHRKLEGSLFSILRILDVSTQAWKGQPDLTTRREFDLFSAAEAGSLFFMFNNIPSPGPSADNVENHFYKAAMSTLLDPHKQPHGLKTNLYPYQKRSAGLMLQRECGSSLQLDPRLEQRSAADGSTFFYGPWDTVFLRSPRFYETCKGGILAETMGLGKTVISIALILSTKGHLPQIPAQYNQIMSRPKAGSLVEMAISSINRCSAPWRTFFEKHELLTGEHMGNCISLMRRNAPSYEVPVEPVRWNRKTTVPVPKKLTLAATTIVVVPTNLLRQWQSELTKHVEVDSLKVLVMNDNKKALPAPDELALFDIALFSRPRFEYENRDGSDSKGRRMSRYPPSCQCPYVGATRTRQCDCIRNDEIYSSPLKSLHFLRIIIDEGHSVSSENTKVALVANKLVEADHRWVMSGTPAKDLLGIEMDIAGPGSVRDGVDAESYRRCALDQRKEFVLKDEKDGAVRNIGSMVTNFLKIRPWAAGEGERAVDWMDHVFRHEMERPRMRTFSGYSKCLRRTLESIVIRTQPADVERDIELPPLSHDIVRLQPSFYDKLTANAFAFVLTANAVTSERTDVDYIFHKNSNKERSQLINNLRQSSFFWTGFSVADMETAQMQSKRYLGKVDKTCTEEDEQLLANCVQEANAMLHSVGWRALSISHEIGLFVEKWPTESGGFWSFDRSSWPLLCGATQLLQAQDHVNRQAAALDPSEGLPGVGLRALAVLRPPATGNPVTVKSGIPTSLVSDQTVRRRSTPSSSDKQQSPSKTPKRRASDPSTLSASAMDDVPPPELPADSELRKTKIVGTTSAKMSYLLSRILEFHLEEKILVFYDGENAAYYIAQVLEIMHINHLIYAKSLPPAKRSEYIVRFNQDPQYRVLLMDVGQAAYGLNIPSASRVFFINPMNRPNDEAQALKRAHRIGQTRKVHAETLILRDTIEEEMFERARRMTRAEHRNAKELDDDGGIRQIIQSARPMPISVSGRKGTGPVAFIDNPQQFWGRPGWATWKAQHVDEPAEPAKPVDQKRRKDSSQSRSGSESSRKRRKTAPTDTAKPVVVEGASANDVTVTDEHNVTRTDSYGSIFGGS